MGTLTLANLALDSGTNRVPLGDGLLAPPELDVGTKDLVMIHEEATVKQTIRDLIETESGECPGHEEEGTNLSEAFLEPVSGILDVLPYQVQQAITLYEKRVTGVKVTAERQDDPSVSRAIVVMKITWKYRASQRPGTLTLTKYLDDTATGEPNGWH